MGELANWPLAVLALVVMRAGAPQGLLHVVLVVLASAVVIATRPWAGDAALRGVNPLHRLLGVAVLTWLAFALVRLG